MKGRSFNIEWVKRTIFLVNPLMHPRLREVHVRIWFIQVQIQREQSPPNNEPKFFIPSNELPKQ